MDKIKGPKTPVQILLIVVLAAALLFAVVLLLRVARNCDAGVEHRAQGECIGVTDGHFTFADELKDVEGKIFAENKRVAKQTKEYVSIAVLRPMTRLDAGDKAALHALEGAYTAQKTANSGSDMRPPIRLLLANDGRDDTQWGPVVDELKKRVGPDSADHLLAVTGFAQSVDGTRQAIRSLSEGGIGMVGGTITGDNLTGSQYPGLVRVAPTNTDEATAGVSFATGLMSSHAPQTIVLVRDTSDPLDDYVRTLGDQISRRLPSGSITETVDSGVPNPFLLLAPQICAEAAQTKAAFVYFAGRPEPLTAFVNQLSSRPCDYPITIVTGDDASRVNGQAVKAALSRGVTLYYTALAHPDAWSSCPSGSAPPVTGGSSRDYEDFKNAFTNDFPFDHLDGEAIIGHDAFLTAVNAVRLAAATTKKTPLTSLTTRDVNAQWNHLHELYVVKGGSGWIWLEDDSSGNPKNKAIPILRIDPDGAVQCVKLAWPMGASPPALRTTTGQ